MLPLPLRKSLIVVPTILLAWSMTCVAFAAGLRHFTWHEAEGGIRFLIGFDRPVESRITGGTPGSGRFVVDFNNILRPVTRKTWNPGHEAVRRVTRLYYSDQNILRFIFDFHPGSNSQVALDRNGGEYMLTIRDGASVPPRSRSLLPPDATRVASPAAPRSPAFAEDAGPAGRFLNPPSPAARSRSRTPPAPVRSSVPPRPSSSRSPVGSRKVVLLDPGHGGKDGGTRTSRPVGGRHHDEKDLVLEICRRMLPLFEQAPNLDVRLTRTGDKYVSLDDRVEMGRRSRADLFLSVHLNASGSPHTASGFEVYYLKDVNSAGTVLSANGRSRLRHNRQQSILAALVMNQTLSAQGPFRSRSRGVKAANFRVLKIAELPSILVECGFLDHPGEAALLTRSQTQDQIAVLLFNAVNRYFARTDPDFVPRELPLPGTRGSGAASAGRRF